MTPHDIYVAQRNAAEDLICANLERLGLVRKTSKEAAQPLSGLSLDQEPKYTTDGTAVFNRASCEAIPPDEPIFIFRARDKSSLVGLLAYLEAIKNREPSGPHAEAVAKRIEDFLKFAADHPERMKWPDTAAPHPTT